MIYSQSVGISCLLNFSRYSHCRFTLIFRLLHTSYTIAPWITHSIRTVLEYSAWQRKGGKDDHIQHKHLRRGETASSSCENQKIWPCPQNKIWPDQRRTYTRAHPSLPRRVRCQLISRSHSHLPGFSGAAPVLCHGLNEPTLLHPARSHYPVSRSCGQQEPTCENRVLTLCGAFPVIFRQDV